VEPVSVVSVVHVRPEAQSLELAQVFAQKYAVLGSCASAMQMPSSGQSVSAWQVFVQMFALADEPSLRVREICVHAPMAQPVSPPQRA
jgi:hypothetical protein